MSTLGALIKVLKIRLMVMIERQNMINISYPILIFCLMHQ